MTDPKQHGTHRRMTASNFSEKWVDSQLQPFIAKNVRLAIDRMAEEERVKGYMDVFKW
jgi:cytochrome P450